MSLSTITEIQEAIAKLPSNERSALVVWLRSQDETRMSDSEEAALLAALDKAADELDDGRGVPVARVREHPNEVVIGEMPPNTAVRASIAAKACG